jgi:glycosyltransferase involved in cell wall biosynthesis
MLTRAETTPVEMTADRRAVPAVDRPVRVLHVITGLGVGGAESMLASLVGAHPPELDQEVVSLGSNGFHADEMRRQGIRVTELALEHLIGVPLGVQKLLAAVQHMKPQVVQGWMYHGNLAALAAATLSGRRRQTCLAWGIRCSDRDLSYERFRNRAVIHAGTYLSPLSDVLVANSRAGLDFHIKHGYRCRESLFIHNGIDVERYRPDADLRARMRTALGIAPEAVVVAHVARVHPMKDHATLVDVARRVPGTWVLAIGAGTGALDGPPNLLKLGRREDVPALLAASDIVASTSVYGEGFSNAIAEGMAAGLVPVATDVGDARMIIGDAGSVVAPRSAQDLADAIAALAALPREELGRKGAYARERVKTLYGLDASVRAFATLYRRLATERALA